MFHVNKLPGGERPSMGQVLFLLRGGADGKEQITNKSCQVMPSYPKSNPVPSQFLPSSFPVPSQFASSSRFTKGINGLSQYTGLSLLPIDQMAGVFSAAKAAAQKVNVIRPGAVNSLHFRCLFSSEGLNQPDFQRVPRVQDNCAPSAADGRNFSRFFTGVSSKKCDMAGDWVRLKKGPYGGDLAQAFSNFFVRRISGK